MVSSVTTYLQRTRWILPGCARPMVDRTPQGGWKDMSIGYGSQLPPSSCAARNRTCRRDIT